MTASRLPRYGLFDWDPDGDKTEEQWATRLAGEGWRMHTPGPGSWVTVNGRRVRRWSLRFDGPPTPP